MSILDYLFLEPIPVDWLIQDAIVLLLALLVLVFTVRREKRPAVVILEMFAFVFLYAAVYENAAGVMGLYTFGRSLVMIGFVPASIPLIEACILFTSFWFLEKTSIPRWAWPPIIGLFGMLQDFSLDPLAIRQIHAVGDGASARWNWVVNVAVDANILRVPVFNFSGWMLIMLYASICILVGRWWYKKSGYRPLVGAAYPFLAAVGALALMVSPISQVLLWLSPMYEKGNSSEWVMLGIHLLVPVFLLIFFWRGRMAERFTFNDLPFFLIPTVLHLVDIIFTLIGGYTLILPLVLLASALQTGFLLFAYLNSRLSDRHAEARAAGPQPASQAT